MDQTMRNSAFKKILDHIFIIVMVNFYALISILLGLVIFGFFPALSATYKMMKLHQAQSDVTFKKFMVSYKKDFKKANVIGFILTLTGIVLYISFDFYRGQLESNFALFAYIIIILLFIVWFFMLNAIFVVNAFFDKLSIKELFSMTLLIIFGMPALSFTVFLNGIFFYGLFIFRFVTLIPFIIISFPAYLGVRIAYKKFIKIYTLYKDEYVTIRTANSVIESNDIVDYILKVNDISFDSDEFKATLSYKNMMIDHISLVLVNHTNDIVGALLVSKETFNIHIDFIHINTEFQHRGYGKKMLEQLDIVALKHRIQHIQYGYKKRMLCRLHNMHLLMNILKDNQYHVEIENKTLIAIKEVNHA